MYPKKIENIFNLKIAYTNASFNLISIIYCIFLAFFCAQNHNIIDEAIYLKTLLNKDNLFFVDFITGTSITHQIGAALLLLGVSQYKLSIIIYFITNLTFWFSCSTIIKKLITKNRLLIFIFLWIITQTNIFSFVNPAYEYPIIYSSHLSTFSSAILILSISLLINKKYKKSIMINFLNVLVHPIIGVFGLLCSIVVIFVEKRDEFSFSKFKSYEILLLLILFSIYSLSLIYIFDLKESYRFISKPIDVDYKNISQTLLGIWSISSHINANYNWFNYFPVLIFSSFLILTFKFKNENLFYNNNTCLFVFFIIPIIITLITQLFLFFNVKIFEQFFLERFLAFSNFILRVFFFKLLVLSIKRKKIFQLIIFIFLFILWPLFFSNFNDHPNNYINIVTKLSLVNLLVLLFLMGIGAFLNGNLIQKYKYIFTIITLMMFIIINEKKLSSVSLYSNPKYEYLTLFVKKDNCPKIEKSSGILISNHYQYNLLLRSCSIVPYTLAHIPDGIIYNNKKIYELTKLFKLIYDVDLLKFEPNRNKDKRLKFSSNFFKSKWEERSETEWQNALKKLNIKYIVAPLEWKIKLVENQKFYKNKIYKIF